MSDLLNHIDDNKDQLIFRYVQAKAVVRRMNKQTLTLGGWFKEAGQICRLSHILSPAFKSTITLKLIAPSPVEYTRAHVPDPDTRFMHTEHKEGPLQCCLMLVSHFIDKPSTRWIFSPTV
jgi:hypothetical protein